MPGYSTTIRTARNQALADAINGGAGAGTLKLYTAPRPATGAAVGAATLLATLTHSDPAQASNSGGVLTFDTITEDSSADATGTAVWARSADSTGTFCADWSVGEIGSGEDIEMNNTDIVSGAPVEAVSWTVTEGNP